MSSELISYLKLKSTQKKFMHLYATQKTYSNIVAVIFPLAIVLMVPLIILKITGEMDNFNLLVCIIFAFVSGIQMRTLGNILHECAHNSFFAKRSWNKKLGHCIAILQFSSFEKYQKQHLSHHLHLGENLKDADYEVGKKFNLEAPLSRKNIAKLFLNIWRLEFYLTYVELKVLDSRESIWLRSMRIVWLIVIIFLIISIGFKSFIIFYAIPFLTIYQWMKFFSDMADHAGVIVANQRELRSRNHIFHSKILNFVLFPRNDCFHLVHHLFPVIPAWNLAKAHKILLDNSSYAQLKHDIEFKLNFKKDS